MKKKRQCSPNHKPSVDKTLGLDELEEQLQETQAALDVVNRENKLLSEKNEELERKIQDLEAKVITLSDQLTKDPMTLFFNKRHFTDYIFPSELDRARRYKQPLSLMVIDIDFLKLINELGHEAGDFAIMQLVEILNDGKKGVRISDIVARIGGDEFVVVCPGTDYERVKTVAKRLCKAMNERWAGAHRLSISVGFATLLNPASTAPIAALAKDFFGLADRACYKAKGLQADKSYSADGRNRVCGAKELSDEELSAWKVITSPSSIVPKCDAA